MTKYVLAVVLLVLVVLENGGMQSRILAKSHVKRNAVDGTINHYHRLAGHQHSRPATIAVQQQQQQHQHQHQQRRHKRHHGPLTEQIPGKPPALNQQQAHTQSRHDNSDEEDNTALVRRRRQHKQHRSQKQLEYARLRRLQKTPALTHSKAIARNALDVQESNFKNIPKLWLHLLSTDERMYGDEPFGTSEESSESAESLLRLALAQQPDDVIEEDRPMEIEVERPAEVERPQAVQCPKCESRRQVETVTEEELTRLRIEFVKQQILEKLRLKERPQVSAVRLPRPIYEGTTIEEEDEDSKSKQLDDYYARTSKKFIFLQREKHECNRLDNQPSICFSFKIDDADADSFDVSTAVLWLFKNKQSQQNDTLLQQETIVVAELQQSPDPKYLPMSKTIAIQSVGAQDEWLKIDIEWPIKRWFGNHELSHLIQISCESCDIDTMISVEKDYRPFIMIDMQNRRRQPRQKRSINCTDGVTECCREKLYISFDEIGWGDWIILPRGYDAYFCRGSCSTVASVAQSSSHHSAFLQKVSSSRRANGRKPLELVPCCTAKQYSSLQIVFMDSNNTATQKTFPNMVVESCGCR